MCATQRLAKIVLVLFVYIICVQSQRQEDFQPKPERCQRSPEFMYQQCCVFPPFFTRNVAKACGAMVKLNFVDNDHNITAFTRRAPQRGCDHWSCILKKYGFLTKSNSVNDERYFAHLDKWADLNPIFSTAVTNAQAHCKNIYRMLMPMEVCEFFKLQGCIRNFIEIDCPALIPTKSCKEKKAFFDECREFFL